MPIDASFAQLLSDRRNELRPPPPRVSMSDYRAAASVFLRAAQGPPVAKVEEATVTSVDGKPLAIRIYRSSEHDPLPAVVFSHGGGFVFGDLDTHDALCRELALQSDCNIVAVAYRLAPEHTFPAAIDDCTTVLEWLVANARTLGVVASALAVAGDSAGANISIATALRAKGRGISLRHAALLYPAVDPSCDSQSMHSYGEGHLLTRRAMEWFWKCYLPSEEMRTHPHAAVLTADLSGFPPTSIVTAEFDPLRDEGEAFAQRLRSAHVPVEVNRFSGMIHGFAGMPHLTPVAREAIAWTGRALRSSLCN
jgi:acetyl esterase